MQGRVLPLKLECVVAAYTVLSEKLPEYKAGKLEIMLLYCVL